ncbi:MAG: holo-ACP synthase [Verrucomicrobiota bacterium]
MKIIGTGVDIVETVRIEASITRHGDRFLQRIFTAQEIAYCSTMKLSARHYAARFAAKEAVSKAFGTGIGEFAGWLDIEVCRSPEGRPLIELHGAAKELAKRLGIEEVLISLSHADHYAVASAVVVGDG